MNRAPAFQTYANEFLAMFAGLSLPAVGAAQRLLLAMWGQSDDQCSLLDDDAMLARMVGISLDEWKELRKEIQRAGRLFEVKKERLISPYLKREAAKQRKYRKLQTEKSRKGVEARLTRGLTRGAPAGEARVTSSPSSSSSTSENKTKTKRCEEASARASKVLVDEEYLKELETAEKFKPFRSLNIRMVALSAEQWAVENNRPFTRQFFLNWLKRESSKPINHAPPGTRPVLQAVSACDFRVKGPGERFLRPCGKAIYYPQGEEPRPAKLIYCESHYRICQREQPNQKPNPKQQISLERHHASTEKEAVAT